MTALGRLGLSAAITSLTFTACQEPSIAPVEPAPLVVAEPEPEPSAGLFDLAAVSLEGQPVDLEDYAGQVVLVVNVASQCGYTPQYAGLQELQDTYGARGLVVLGFPSNEFGGQEPGTAEEIRAFCSESYRVDFPMFAKTLTQPGPQQSPIYTYLQKQTGEVPNWNFCKYLVGRDGTPVAFWRSNTAPLDGELVKAVEAQL